MDGATGYPLPALIADPRYIALFEKLYDSLGHRQGFEAFLQGLKQHFQSSSVALMALQSDPGTVEWSWISGVDPVFGHWIHENEPLIVKALADGPLTQCTERFFCAGLLLEQHELVDVVADDLKPWLRKENIVDTAGLLIPIGERGHVFLALQRDISAGRFSPADMETLNLLVPHLKRVANLLFRLYYGPATLANLSADEIRQRFPLTHTEAQVCELMVRKLTPKQIARHRDVSVHTVREQMRKIYKKTGCRRQVDLVTVILQALACPGTGEAV